MKKQKATVNSFLIVHPKKKKEKIVAALMLLAVLCGISPFINLVNVPALICGLPAIGFTAVVNAVLVLIVLRIAYRWEVH